MNKIITLIIAAALSVTALNARQLTPGQAWVRAASIPNIKQKTRGLSDNLPNLIKSVKTSDNQLAYYIFDIGGNTVFISADDVAIPVLGYTDERLEDLSQIPPAMAYMLNIYAREIEWVKAHGFKASYATSRAEDWPKIQPLVKTKWDQDSPYNDLCPLKNGQETYSGCVATAMAQAMGYYRYPDVGHGTISYQWNQQTLSIDLSDSPIRWNDILPTYTKSEPGTEAQRSAIASFLRDCGYSLHMEYGGIDDNGSSAQTYNIPQVLVNNYDYDKGVRHERHVFYSQPDWEQLIYDELAASRPIVYSGQGDNGGHAFICDGYQGEGLFHINWGWSGSSDGYFALTALDPYTLGAGGGSGGFNYDQQAVIGIQLPQPGTVAPTPYIGSGTTIYGSSEGYELSIKPTENGMLPGAFRNMGREAARFTFGVKLVGNENGDIIYLTDENIVNQLYGTNEGFGIIKVTVPTQTQPDDYKAYPVYKCNDGEWKEIRVPYDSRKFIRITVTSDYIEVSPEDGTTGVAILSFEIPQTLVINEEYSINIMLHNTSTFSQYYNYIASLYESADDNLTLADLGEVQGHIEAGTTETVSIKGVFDDSVMSFELTPGDYILNLESDNGWSREFNVKVTDKPTGIGNIDADIPQNKYRLYDLSGRLVNTNRLTPGVYIKVSNRVQEKILIK